MTINNIFPYLLLVFCFSFLLPSCNETNTIKPKENTIETAPESNTPSDKICRRLKEETKNFIEQRRNIKSRSRYVDSVYYLIEFIKSESFESKIIISTSGVVPGVFPEYIISGYIPFEFGKIIIVDDTLRSNAKYYSCFDVKTDIENLQTRLTTSFYTPSQRKDFAIKNDSIFLIREYGFP